MKCACQDAKCDKIIGVDTITGTVIIEDDKSALSAYLDPNLAVQLIRQLHAYLRDVANKEDYE